METQKLDRNCRCVSSSEIRIFSGEFVAVVIQSNGMYGWPTPQKKLTPLRNTRLVRPSEGKPTVKRALIKALFPGGGVGLSQLAMSRNPHMSSITIAR